MLYRVLFLTTAWLVFGNFTASAQTNAAAAPTPPAAGKAAVPPDVASALQMPAGPDQKKALSTAAQAWAKSDPIAFFTWLFTVDKTVYGEVWQSASSAGESADPKAAADFLAQHVSGPTMILLHLFTIGWARHDSAAAEAWCTQPQLAKDARYLAIYSVADALCRKSPPTATAWVATLTDPETRIAAVDGTVTIWCRGDAAAAAAWIKQLSPPEIKRAAQTVASDWKLTKGALGPTVDDWVNSLPLSDADKQDVLKGLRPDPYHISTYHSAPAPSK